MSETERTMTQKQAVSLLLDSKEVMALSWKRRNAKVVEGKCVCKAGDIDHMAVKAYEPDPDPNPAVDPLTREEILDKITESGRVIITKIDCGEYQTRGVHVSDIVSIDGVPVMEGAKDGEGTEAGEGS